MATLDKGTWWRTQRLTTSAQVLRRLASATDRWVIVGEDSGSPLILTVETADFNDIGPTFTTRTPNGTDALWDVAYIGTEDRVNAVGDNGRVEFSQDKGQTWNSLVFPGNEDLRGIVGVSGDANSRFVAVGNGRVYGQNSSGVWSARWSGANSWLSVAHRATAGWVAVGTTGDGLYSADGLTWGSAFKIDPTLDINDIDASGSYFMAVGDTGGVYRSVTGQSGAWTRLSIPTTLSLRAVISMGFGDWVAFSFGGRSWVSLDDGATWIENAAIIADEITGAYNTAGRAGACGTVGGVYVSYDLEQADYVSPVATPAPPPAFTANDDMAGDAVRRLVTQFRSGRG